MVSPSLSTGKKTKVALQMACNKGAKDGCEVWVNRISGSARLDGYMRLPVPLQFYKMIPNLD